MKIKYYYRLQRSWAKVMFLQASVILSTGGGVCLSACWDARPPQEQTPPQTRHPPNQTPLWTRHPREQTPPFPPNQAPLPPREADARIRSMSYRYPSYWNAFLLLLFFFFTYTRWYSLTNEWYSPRAQPEVNTSVGGECHWYLQKMHCVTILLHGLCFTDTTAVLPIPLWYL